MRRICALETLFEKWWCNGNKVFAVYNYRGAWKVSDFKPHLAVRTNGARKRKGSSCLDVSITIGYIVINYVNFDLQGKCKEDK